MLGQEIERQQFDSVQEIHEFSSGYEKQKKELLRKLETKNKKMIGIRKMVQVAAVFVILIGFSVTVYAVTSHTPAMRAVITNNKETKTVSFEIKRNKKSKPQHIDITPIYLPPGYEEWEYGKYSYGGVWAAAGLTIQYYDYIEKDRYKYEHYEERQIGDAKAIILDNGIESDYPRWFVLMFYEEDGHTIAVWGYKEIKKEELLKVCESLAYEEISEEEYLKRINSEFFKINKKE